MFTKHSFFSFRPLASGASLHPVNNESSSLSKSSHSLNLVTIVFPFCHLILEIPLVLHLERTALTSEDSGRG